MRQVEQCAQGRQHSQCYPGKVLMKRQPGEKEGPVRHQLAVLGQGQAAEEQDGQGRHQVSAPVRQHHARIADNEDVEQRSAPLHAAEKMHAGGEQRQLQHQIPQRQDVELGQRGTAAEQRRVETIRSEPEPQTQEHLCGYRKLPEDTQDKHEQPESAEHPPPRGVVAGLRLDLRAGLVGFGNREAHSLPTALFMSWFLSVRYPIVVCKLACPASFAATEISTPFWISRERNVCRPLCGVKRTGRLSALRYFTASFCTERGEIRLRLLVPRRAMRTYGWSVLGR